MVTPTARFRRRPSLRPSRRRHPCSIDGTGSPARRALAQRPVQELKSRPARSSFAPEGLDLLHIEIVSTSSLAFASSIVALAFDGVRCLLEVEAELLEVAAISGLGGGTGEGSRQVGHIRDRAEQELVAVEGAGNRADKAGGLSAVLRRGGGFGKSWIGAPLAGSSAIEGSPPRSSSGTESGVALSLGRIDQASCSGFGLSRNPPVHVFQDARQVAATTPPSRPMTVDFSGPESFQCRVMRISAAGQSSRCPSLCRMSSSRVVPSVSIGVYRTDAHY